jgi:hypothetical protein
VHYSLSFPKESDRAGIISVFITNKALKTDKTKLAYIKWLMVYLTAAITDISTNNASLAILASTHALAGADPSGTHASHTSFMPAKCKFISFT